MGQGFVMAAMSHTVIIMPRTCSRTSSRFRSHCFDFTMEKNPPRFLWSVRKPHDPLVLVLTAITKRFHHNNTTTTQTPPHHNLPQQNYLSPNVFMSPVFALHHSLNLWPQIISISQTIRKWNKTHSLISLFHHTHIHTHTLQSIFSLSLSLSDCRVHSSQLHSQFTLIRSLGYWKWWFLVGLLY